MTTHVIEVGPGAIRQLCCGGAVIVDNDIADAALESIDDAVTLMDFQPVTVETVWRTVLASMDCAAGDTAIVVHPSWWAQTRVDVVGEASHAVAGEVVVRPRTWLLTEGFLQATVVVEIADSFVVITGATVVAHARRGDSCGVVEAIVDSVLEAADSAETVVIDAPSTVSGASALAAMIAEELRDSRLSATQVDDDRLRELAGAVIPSESSTVESNSTDGGMRHQRRHWRLALVIPVLGAALAAGALRHHGAPADAGTQTAFLLEGHVALEVPAQWPMQRIVSGPGSARLQVTSPSDPEVALHVTQSRVALATLDATAEFLKQAIDAEQAGIFVDFNPTGQTAGRPAVTYREIRPDHDVRWSILVDKDVRISIGCQSRRGHDDAVRQACELAVRSARAVA
jgi:type VII secretion-associated protein (TIGR03931 family)